MKKFNSLLSMLMAIAIVFSLSTTVGAVDVSEQQVNISEAVELSMDNMTFSEAPDGGITAQFDLVREVASTEGDSVSPAGIGWVEVVGWGQMKCQLLPGNGVGYFYWDLHLSNGDLIKKVKGTFVFERNNALLPDFNIAKETVKKEYTTGTLYDKAQGAESFDCPSNIDYEMNVRFKWDSFEIQGVTDKYIVNDGSVTGTVEDFF